MFPFKQRMADYLTTTERTSLAEEAVKYKDSLLTIVAGTKYDQVRNKHGHLERTAYKLSATKIEHSHWSTGHSTQL